MRTYNRAGFYGALGLFVVNGVLPFEIMPAAAVLSIGWTGGLASILWAAQRRKRLKTLSTVTGD